MNEGYSRSKAVRMAEEWVAVPGTSEHIQNIVTILSPFRPVFILKSLLFAISIP